MRLDKYLADMGIGTRSEVKKIIKSGRILVDGTVQKDPGRAVTGESFVTMDGQAVRYETNAYYMLNKPAGVVSTTEDVHQKTVLDLLPESVNKKNLFPVGRLDKDTVGLLLITDDGELAHRLLSPKRHVDKTYLARVRGAVGRREIGLFAGGLVVDKDFKALPAKLEVMEICRKRAGEKPDTGTASIGEDGAVTGAEEITVSEVRITIREGKFHQIKRMFAAVGMEVIYLKRLSMGTLILDGNLQEGQYRRLTGEEVEKLKSR